MATLNKSTLERLLLYYHFIQEHLDQAAANAFSSTQLAQMMDVDDTQVRKDLSSIGLRGAPRVGFDTSQVKDRICDVLGFNQGHKAVVIGAGRLGGAIASYKEFQSYGVEVVALFDNDPNKISLMVRSHIVQPMTQLEAIIQQMGVTMGILTTPPDAAQDLADRLVSAGVNALWSFSPTHIDVPDGVVVRHEHLSVGLAEILYHLKTNGTS